MQKLIATKGLPGSGKSTWAEDTRAQLEACGFKVLVSNKDDIRKALNATGWTWSQEAEKDVIKFQNNQIKSAFDNGTDVVIVADTNFGTHLARLEGIAKHMGAAFAVQDFTTVPLQTCIERDARREVGRVGDKVIREMYMKYITPIPTKYIPVAEAPSAVICDLDGTLALKGNRSPFDYSKVGLDAVNEPIADILRMAVDSGYEILYVSGREDSCMDATLEWLDRNKLPAGPLWMRKTGDHRKDYIIKLEIFDAQIRNNYNIKFVLDDRDQVVKMWRELGLACLQVAYGNF